MRLIFLDVDGVLKRYPLVVPYLAGMDPDLVQRFNDLCVFTGASVVLSSTWRQDPNWLETMRKNGLACNFAGATPRLPGHLRGDEIDHWLAKQFGEPEQYPRYAIIDDDSDFFWTQPFFQTDPAEGLTEEIAEQVAKHLLA